MLLGNVEADVEHGGGGGRAVGVAYCGAFEVADGVGPDGWQPGLAAAACQSVGD